MGAQTSNLKQNRVWADEGGSLPRGGKGENFAERKAGGDSVTPKQASRTPQRGVLGFKRWGSPLLVDSARVVTTPDSTFRRPGPGPLDDSAEYKQQSPDGFRGSIPPGSPGGEPASSLTWYGWPVTAEDAGRPNSRGRAQRNWKSSVERLSAMHSVPGGGPGSLVDTDCSDGRGGAWNWRVGRARPERSFSQIPASVLQPHKPHSAADFLRGLPSSLLASLGPDRPAFFASFSELSADLAEAKRAACSVADGSGASSSTTPHRRLEAWGAQLPPEIQQPERPSTSQHDDRRPGSVGGPDNAPSTSGAQPPASLRRVVDALQGRRHKLNHSIHPWLLPEIINVSEWEVGRCSVGSPGEYEYYKDFAQNSLKEGRFAFHVTATIGAVTGACPFLPECDPHLLAERWGGDRGIGMQLRGIPLAQRHLCAIAAGIERCAGHDAVRRCKLVVTVDAESEPRLLADLVARKFYGFDPDNILVAVHLKAPGFRPDASAGAFVRDDSSLPLPFGPGVDLEQLSWANEGFGVSPSGKRAPLPAGVSCLTHLLRLGALWLVASRVDDVHKLDSSESVSLPALANLVRVVENGTASCLVEVEPSDDLSAPHGLAVRVPFVPQPSGLRMALSAHSVIVVPRELCQASEAAANVKDMYRRGALFAPTERWSYCLPSLICALAAEQDAPQRTFSPHAQLDPSGPGAPVVRPVFRVGDLTYSSMRCSAYVETHGGLAAAQGGGDGAGAGLSEFQRSSRLAPHDDMEALRDALLRAVTLQDADAAFVGVALRLAPAAAPVTVVSPLPSNPMLRLVFFSTDEARTEACLADSIKLLHSLLASDSGTEVAKGLEAIGQKLLRGLLNDAAAAAGGGGGDGGGGEASSSQGGLGRPLSARVVGGPALPRGMGFELRYAHPQASASLGATETERAGAGGDGGGDGGGEGVTASPSAGGTDTAEPPTTDDGGDGDWGSAAGPGTAYEGGEGAAAAADCDGDGDCTPSPHTPPRGQFGEPPSWPQDPLWEGHVGNTDDAGRKTSTPPAPLFGLVSASEAHQDTP